VPSRQDQLHSYQYSLQRVVAALVTHDPDPARSPLRRAGMTALVSLLIASLAVGAAAIYGLLTGNSNVKVRDPGVVFQEKGTGARFVYLASDEKLHPVLNYASGLLVASAQSPSLKSVSPDKLASVPLGDPVGIPDAPDSLPRPGSLIVDRWSVCNDNQGENPRSTLLVGDRLTDGTVLSRAARGFLVRDPEQQVYLVFDNRRFAIPGARLVTTLRALRWADQQPWPVSLAWINAVPPGPDLTAPALPEGGGRSSVDGFSAGQLVTDGRQVAVILQDGAAALTDMQALLMQADPDAGRPADIGADFLRLPPSRTVISDKGRADALPATVPPLLDKTPVRSCVTLPVDPRNGDGIRIDPAVPAGIAASGADAPPGAVLADQVHVARGRGALAVVAATPSTPAGSGTVSLVTDTGLQYPLANRGLLAKLGYGDVRPRQIPASLISLLPLGPALDPARARQTNPQ
jgi:ESX secretion system ATPase EccB